jgi:hypothetical protein
MSNSGPHVFISPVQTGERDRAKRGGGGVGFNEFLSAKVVRRVRRPLHHPSLALRMVPLPRFAGAENRLSFSRRMAPESCDERHETFRLQTRREAERRQAHRSCMSAPRSQTLPPENAPGAVARHTDKRCRLPALRARSPLGAPPRYLPRKLMPRLSPGRASCEREDAGVTHIIERTHSDAPRAPVIVPAGSMPGPPGSGVTNPARRNRTRSVSRCVSRPRPFESEMKQ